MGWKRNVLRTAFALTLIPNLCGIIYGVLFVYHSRTRVAEQVHRLKFELEQAEWMDWFSVPGLPIHDWDGPPFYAPELKAHNWRQKLNLTVPLADEADDAGIDKMASLSNLFKDVSDPTQTRHSWVYVSKWGMPQVDAWDKAFDELLTYHYVHPAAHDASLGFVKDAGISFLSSIWGASAPAIVHFEVQSEDCHIVRPSDITAFSSGFGQSKYLCPVLARVIDLPLTDMPWTPNAAPFPSEFEQLRTLTHDPFAYEYFDPFDPIAQIWQEWEVWADALEECNTAMSLLRYVDDNYEKLFGPLQDIVWIYSSVVFFFTAAIAKVTIWIVESACDVVLWFLGFPGSSGTPVVERQSHKPTQDTNMMSYIFRSFMESIQDEIPDNAKHIVEEHMRPILEGSQA